VRDGISAKKAAERVRAQKDDSFYTENSDYTIYNGKDMESFTKDIAKIEALIL
jgi:dephospho-CoA kinase